MLQIVIYKKLIFWEEYTPLYELIQVRYRPLLFWALELLFQRVRKRKESGLFSVWAFFLYLIGPVPH